MSEPFNLIQTFGAVGSAVYFVRDRRATEPAQAERRSLSRAFTLESTVSFEISDMPRGRIVSRDVLLDRPDVIERLVRLVDGDQIHAQLEYAVVEGFQNGPQFRSVGLDEFYD
jgi:hypothetical protein